MERASNIKLSSDRNLLTKVELFGNSLKSDELNILCTWLCMKHKRDDEELNFNTIHKKQLWVVVIYAWKIIY